MLSSIIVRAPSRLSVTSAVATGPPPCILMSFAAQVFVFRGQMLNQ